jgi:hypothetical protein
MDTGDKMISTLSPAMQGLIGVGVVTFLLLGFQVLVGLRVITFKGRTHMRVHKWGAFALLALSAVHGIYAFAVFLG